MKSVFTIISLTLLALLPVAPATADGLVVDKVYHPYVIANEQEFEWRLLSSHMDKGNRLGQRLGYGHSFGERVAVEIYMLGERDSQENFGLQAYEIEARWMITEQGQFWADWGMLFELEKQHQIDNWEAKIGVLAEKEFGKSSLTTNLFAIREWGQTLQSEWESQFRMQYRYRFILEIQPAIELYMGEDFVGIGPAIMGLHRYTAQRQIKWELGLITEVGHAGKDQTLRLDLEFEF
jgi:hypothetical protein